MTDPMTYLDEVDARVADCSTYNFGMRNADDLAHVDAPALSKALRAVLELHRHVQLPISGSSLGDVTYSVGCAHCTRSAEVATYPCPTVKAIQAALAVNGEGEKVWPPTR